MMKRIKEWISQSHRLQHIVGGMIIGLLAFNLYTALYTGAACGGSLELKDRLYGNKWDWIDFTCTLFGSLVGNGLNYLFKTILL